MNEHESESIKKDRVLATLMANADKYFPRLNPELSNGQLLLKAISTKGVSSFIIQRLEKIEREGELFGNDVELNSWFENQVRLGTIIAPIDPVDKFRWLALLSFSVSKKENLSCENVVIVPDYLPDGKDFWEYESIYGVGVLDDILSKRASIRK